MRTLLVVLSVISLVGCKTDKKQPAKTPEGSGSAVATGSAAKPMNSASGSGSAAKATINVTLPKGDGTPPKPTTKPLDKAAYAELAKLQFPGFTSQVRNQDTQLDVRHLTPRPALATTVTIAPCVSCLPMDLEKWKAKEAGLKMLLVDELRDRPDTVWELGKTEINGQTFIYTYQFGYLFGKDEQGNPEGAYSNAYALYFADGNNQIRVVAEYKDDPVTREDMKAIAPRQDLERLAKAFMDFYTHAW